MATLLQRLTKYWIISSHHHELKLAAAASHMQPTLLNLQLLSTAQPHTYSPSAGAFRNSESGLSQQQQQQQPRPASAHS
jgi:hypothetical protein